MAQDTSLTQFRQYCSVAAVVMAEQVYEKAVHEDTTLAAKIEAAKWFAKMADYEPKANMQVNAGSGFQLIINYSSAPAETIQGATIDMAPQSELDSPPAHVQIRPTRNAQFLTHELDTVHTAEVC